MTTSSARVWLVIAAILTGGAALSGAPAAAKGNKQADDSSAKHEVNACGCYADATGACFCGKKSKCACPGECEPKGCDAKREKELQKQVQAETKKAHEADQKQRAHEKATKGSAKKTAKAVPTPKPVGLGQ
jgi:hypothetical protein